MTLSVLKADLKENVRFEWVFFLAPQNVFTRQLCLEHDEKLVSYLSLLRDIEMRTKQIQPLELNLAELQDLLCQAKVGSQRLPPGPSAWEKERRHHKRSFWRKKNMFKSAAI